MLLPEESLEYSSETTKYIYDPCQCCWCKAFKSGDTHCHFCINEIEYTERDLGLVVHKLEVL